jgi:flagellar protein FlaG
MTNPIAAAFGPAPIEWPAKSTTARAAPAAEPRPASSAPPVAPAQPDLQDRIRAAAQLLQEFVQQSGRDVKFSVDGGSDRMVVRIFNRATGELVRQVPSEEVLRVAALLREDMADGSGIDERA